MAQKLRIELVKSTIGRKPSHRATVKALGLGKVNSSTVVEATPPVKGMVDKISYLLKIEELK